MKVIASAGTDEKVEYLKSLGVDVAFNYKKEGYSSFLAKNKPFQVYWDNVGGEALEAAIEHIEPFSHIVCCGSLGDYQRAPEERYGIKNTTLIFKRRLTIRGFLVPDLIPKFAGKFFAEIPALVAQGKLKSQESIIEGLENAPDAFLRMLKGGESVGKVVVLVSKE
ncbi:hypothetical protein PTI98_013374 [Pleurotus ostreatus]|nr:hypothetical protein PTI98_013374 [Pleurotus ostreatus]